MNNIKLSALTIMLSFSLIAGAQQDIHFSQFFSSPVAFNPASAGVFNGDLRGFANYRDQYTTVGESFTTMAASFDWGMFNKQISNGYFGGGVNFYMDKAGVSQLETVNYNLSLAYHLDISGNETQYLSAGFRAGMLQRTLTASSLSWDSQWTGYEFDTDRPSNEQFGDESISKFDLGGGLHWNYMPSKTTRVFAGASFFHLTAPDISLDGAEENLFRKYLVHGGGEFDVSGEERIFLLPNMFYMYQGPNNVINFGTDVKFVLQDASKVVDYKEAMALSFGMYTRWGDAVYALTRFEWASFGVGVSYDYNVSDLNVATNGFGAYEVMLTYRASFSGSQKQARFK